MTETVLEALRGIRLPYAIYEIDIHRYVQEALGARNITFMHEARLSEACRIDYMVDGVGIEIKKGKPNKRQLLAQLHRYLAHDELQGIIVVSWHSVQIPEYINGKRAELIVLSQLWGLSLP